jgi:hypothetical protein
MAKSKIERSNDCQIQDEDENENQESANTS